MDPTPSRRVRVVAVALTVVLVALAGVLAWYSRLLRPTGDDYWYPALIVRHGFLGSLHYWGTHFGNMFSKELMVFATVGLAGVHLPWPLVSAIPFWLGIATVAAAVRIAVGPLGATITRDRRLIATLLTATSVVGWSLYWWASLATLNERSVEYAGGYQRDLGLFFTHYQAATMAYLPLALLAIAGAFRFLRHRAYGWKRLAAAVLAGVGLGFGNYTQVALIAVLCAIAFLLSVIQRAGLTRRDLPSVMTFGTTLALTAVSTLLMPGTRARNEIVEQISDRQTSTSAGEVAFKILSQTRDLLVSPSALLVLALFVLVGAVVSGLTRVDARKLTLTAAGFAVVSALMTTVAGVVGWQAGYVKYAPWHLGTSGLLAFVALATLGLAAGSYVRNDASGSIRLLAIGIGMSALLASAWAIRAQCLSIEYRYTKWVSGPAPVPPIADIETNSDKFLTPWRSSWETLVEVRGDTPERATTIDDGLSELTAELQTSAPQE